MGEEQLLAGMKHRARSEIRVAERNGVVAGRVELNEENRSRMIELMRETRSARGRSSAASDYLERVWTAFADDDRGDLYFASHEGRVVAGAFVARLRAPPPGTRTAARCATSHSSWRRGCCSGRSSATSPRPGSSATTSGTCPRRVEPDAPGQGVLIFKSAFARDVVEFMPAFLLADEPAADDWRRGERDFLADYHQRTGDYWY